MGNIEGLIEGQKHLMMIGKMMGVHHQVAHRQLLADIALRAIQLSVVSPFCCQALIVS